MKSSRYVLEGIAAVDAAGLRSALRTNSQRAELARLSAVRPGGWVRFSRKCGVLARERVPIGAPLAWLACSLARLACPLAWLACPLARLACPLARLACPLARLACPLAWLA